MAIDPRIALGFQTPEQPSQLNMLARALQLQGMQRQNQLGSMQLREAETAAQERAALKNYLSGGANIDTPEGAMGLYKVAPTQAAGILKGRLDLTKTRGEIAKDAATVKKTEQEAASKAFELKREKFNFSLQGLAGVQTPEQAAQWIQGGLKSGLIDMKQATQELQGIPSDPQGFAQWKQAQQAAGLTIAQQMEQQWKAKDFGLKSANEIIGPDGRPNRQLIDAKKQIARAGSSTVNVNATQEKEESKAVGKFLGEQYAEIQKAGIGAQAKMDRAARMEQLLSRINTGKFEGVKKEAAAVGQALGVTIDPNLGDKEAFEALSNQLALEARNPSGGAGMPGAMSDKDREFLQQITPNLTKTPDGNRIIIDTAKKLAKRDADVARLAREYRAKSGTLDEGFFEELRQYSDSNPLFSGAAPVGPDIDSLVNKYRTPTNGNPR